MPELVIFIPSHQEFPLHSVPISFPVLHSTPVLPTSPTPFCFTFGPMSQILFSFSLYSSSGFPYVVFPALSLRSNSCYLCTQKRFCFLKLVLCDNLSHNSTIISTTQLVLSVLGKKKTNLICEALPIQVEFSSWFSRGFPLVNAIFPFSSGCVWIHFFFQRMWINHRIFLSLLRMLEIFTSYGKSILNLNKIWIVGTKMKPVWSRQTEKKISELLNW